MHIFKLTALILTTALALGFSPNDTEAARARDNVPTPVTDEIDKPFSNPLVKRVQKALSEAGYYKGKLDGILGPRTETAIRRYQRREGMPVNGIASEELAIHVETSGKVQSLLKQLQKQRVSKIEAARKALMERPETRDLLKDDKTGKEIADPNRDPTPCFKNPTPACLLKESAESAKAIFKTELRDWTLGEILVAQAKAGLVDEAMETVRRIDDPRLMMVALRDIAEAQAQAGRPVEALAAAAIIPDTAKQAEAFAAIGKLQIQKGNLNGAEETVHLLLDAVKRLKDPLKASTLRSQGAVILFRAGKQESAAEILHEARSWAEGDVSEADANVALRHVAGALAEMEQPENALALLEVLPGQSEHIPVLVSAAQAQARAGKAQEAIKTAEAIDIVRYKAVVLSKIAVAQAQMNNPAQARQTVDQALVATKEIKLPFAQAYAHGRIALALIEIGKKGDPEAFRQAVDSAGRISDDKIRARTLWNIADANQDETHATETRVLAEKATEDIISDLSKMWMFCEIALDRKAAGKTDVAWQAFNRALDISESIPNAWGRARAMAKLASSLIDLTAGN